MNLLDIVSVGSREVGCKEVTSQDIHAAGLKREFYHLLFGDIVDRSTIHLLT